VFVLYKSSAGSGKTFTLVKEYLKICLVHPHKYASILAITFTNKAAAEMKTRIIDSLHNFFISGSDDIVDLVIKEKGLPAEKAKENCTILLNHILHSYSDFSVMTIDSFIGRIVRTFAYDLEMPLKFDVELDTENITNEVVDRLIADARRDNFVGDILTEFAISKIHSTGSWFIDNELKKIGQVTFNEKYFEPVGELSLPQFNESFWRELIGTIAQGRFEFQKHVNSLATQALKIIKNFDLKIDDFAYKKTSAASVLEKYAEGTVPIDFKFSQRLADGQWTAKNTPSEILQKITAALEAGLGQIATEIVDYINNNMEQFISYYLVFKNIYSEALINQFIRLTEGYKTEKNIVPLFDFSRKVSDIVKNEPVPFLYWRLGNQYHHIMIDEFQDTSRLQWINLIPLVEEALANGHFNMAVGDGKQAIYRWRAGDVQIMENQLPNELGGHLTQNQLDHNYRSRKEIVEFNNHFFSTLTGRFDGLEDSLFSKLYSGGSVKQQPVSEKKGYVKVALVDITDAKGKVEERERILESIYSDIRIIIEEKNGYTCQDIAILVRKNTEAVRIAQYLSEKDIDVISPDSLQLYNASVVRFVISALRYVTSKDRISLFNMWLFSGKDAADFDRRIKMEGGAQDIENSLSTKFADRMRMMYQLPVYEAIEEIIGIFDLNETYWGFLQGLLEVALNHSEKISSDIHRFLEWWDEDTERTKATLSSVEDSDAVTISTIHKSKGLEFPIVLVPFEWDIVDSPRGGKLDFLWVQSQNFGSKLEAFPFIVDLQKDLEASWFRREYHEEKEMSRLDNLNLLYVAFTRAIDRLYLYVQEEPGSAENEQKEPKNTVELITNSIKDMKLQVDADGLVLGEPSEKSATRDESEMVTLDMLPTYHWRKKITMKRRARDLWKLDETELKEKMEKGVLIHEILAGIETTADIEKAVEDKYRLGLINSEERIEFAGLIAGLMDIEYSKGKVGDWFKPGWVVKNEKTIASRQRECRPDRVLIDEGRTIVIDYKTGQKEPDHLTQINDYGDLLQEMGYEHIEKYLLYLESREVVEA